MHKKVFLMTSSSPVSKGQTMPFYEEQPLLVIENLVIEYPTSEGALRAVDHVSFKLYPGEVLGLVGESGCGKSTLGFAILGLLRGGFIRSGKILFESKDLAQMSEQQIRKLRGSDIAMIFQASQNALNPLQKVSKHFVDTLKAHGQWNEKARNDVKELLNRLEISESRLEDYPFQFSGGMQQRIVIGLSLLMHPKLILADEPTTALDVLVQARILQLLKELKTEFNLTAIYITHDLGVVAEITHRVAIMYAGQIVEIGDTFTIFEQPAHPYTQGLISAIPNVKDKAKR
ncbi:MAG: ABC transporter ATP-binding protein, partial [Candidatus Hodarchaeota archaeon]